MSERPFGGPYHYLLTVVKRLVNLANYENKHPGSVLNETGIFPINLTIDSTVFESNLNVRNISLNYTAGHLTGRPDFLPMTLDD